MRPFVALGMAWWLGMVSLRAEEGGTFLTLGTGPAQVREIRTFVFSNDTCNFVLNNLPEQARLDTLQVDSTRYGIQLLEWRRLLVPPRASGLDARGNYVWRPDVPLATDPDADAGARVEGRLTGTRLNGPQDLALMYNVDGLSWHATYGVLIRGDLSREGDVISCDVEGLLDLSNATSRTFTDARIRLTGLDIPADLPPRKESGFLYLDEENPLWDIWRDSGETRASRYSVDLAQRVRLPAHGHTRIPFLQAARVPGKLLYRITSDSLSRTGQEQEGWFNRVLVIENSAKEGLGRALPAGGAFIYMGSLRNNLIDRAWFGYTPELGQIRIDLGRAAEVRGTIRPLGRGETRSGLYDQEYEIEIINDRKSIVDVEIQEEPSTTLEWSVIRANADYTIQGRRILFTLKVDPAQRRPLRYTLRIREPSV